MAGNSGDEGRRYKKEKKAVETEPLVSVIIPVHNGAATLPAALDSALCQEAPTEIIVIDDGSEDDLESVHQAYKDYPQIIWEKNEKNIGAAASRNKGVKKAGGRYIAFLDADDFWTPDKLQKQLELLEAGRGVLCSTARELVTPDGKQTGKIIGVKERISYRDLLRHNSINCSSVLLPKKIALEFPMEHEDSHEDYITWLKILKKYGDAVGINEPLLKYRLSNSGKSGSKLKSAGMTFRVYRYMGFGWIRSLACFVSYAVHGVWKYKIAGHIRTAKNGSCA